MTLKRVCDVCDKILVDNYIGIEISQGGYKTKHFCPDCFKKLSNKKLLTVLDLQPKKETTDDTKSID